MILFCTGCGYRTYTQAQAISQEVCNNCGQQGSMKELRLKPENVKREVEAI